MKHAIRKRAISESSNHSTGNHCPLPNEIKVFSNSANQKPVSLSPDLYSLTQPIRSQYLCHLTSSLGSRGRTLSEGSAGSKQRKHSIGSEVKKTADQLMTDRFASLKSSFLSDYRTPHFIISQLKNEKFHPILFNWGDFEFRLRQFVSQDPDRRGLC